MKTDSDCNNCEHLNIFTGNTCRAFPGAIPDEVLSGIKKHTSPVQGQKGEYVFSEKPDPDFILDDRDEVWNIFGSSCTQCKYFKDEIYSCDAFPYGVPDEMLSGDDKHLEVVKGQIGAFTFVPEEE